MYKDTKVVIVLGIIVVIIALALETYVPGPYGFFSALIAIVLFVLFLFLKSIADS